MKRSKVAVVRVRPDTILDDIDRLHGLAEVEQALSLEAPTVIADNLSWHFPFPGANSTPWQLEGTVRSLRSRGYDELVAVQNVPPRAPGNAPAGEDLNGYLPILETYGVPVRNHARPEEVTWTTYQPKARMRVLDTLLPDGITIPDALHDTNIVHLPTMKCDVDTTTAGAIANVFDGLTSLRRAAARARMHEVLVDLLAIQKEIHAGQFAVMDGTTAGDGPGPRTLRPVVKDVLLASADPVALDAVATSMMGFDPESLPYLSLAAEQGLGNARRADIEVVGDAAIADQRWGFSVGVSGGGGALGRLRSLVAQTPLASLVTIGEGAYHDLYRWPLHDRKVFEQWRESTAWGQLFDFYQANKTLASDREG